ncbi:MAG: hypothetical protein LBB63_01675, partial [Holosporaceae bacterium]|nr:hypothetical protein [Holosporaceae bacterium]
MWNKIRQNFALKTSNPLKYQSVGGGGLPLMARASAEGKKLLHFPTSQGKLPSKIMQTPDKSS